MPLRGGVRSIKKVGSAALQGDVTLSEGLNITLTQAGQDISAAGAAGDSGTPATTVTNETTFGISAAVGTATNYAREDHTHGTPIDPVTAHVALGDPHTQYQRESEKDAASGYAGLSAGSKLAGAQQTYGSGVNTACEGNDARLSDARVPTTHDILTKHNGFPGGGTTFLRDDGTFAAPTAVAGDLDRPETGALTIATAKYHLTAVRHSATGSQRITVAGTGRWRIQN